MLGTHLSSNGTESGNLPPSSPDFSASIVELIASFVGGIVFPSALVGFGLLDERGIFTGELKDLSGSYLLYTC